MQLQQMSENADLSLNKYSSEVPPASARKLEEIPLLNVDNDEIKNNEDFEENCKDANALVGKMELVTKGKDAFGSTFFNTAGESISLSDGREITVGNIKVKVEDEISQKSESTTIECENDFVQFNLDGLTDRKRKLSGMLCDKKRGEEKQKRTNAVKGPLKYVCKLCGIRSQTAYSLKNHIMTHTGKKPHSCPYCSMSFHQSHHLIEHERIHTGERPFECDLCEDTFTTKSALKSHMKVHSGIKDFKCQACCSAFSDRMQLKIHMRKHDKKFFDCTECGDRFVTAPRLRRHQMIHTGERPFQCEECGVAFREATTLRAHMGTHLPRGPFPCDLCGEVFSRLNSLSLHKKVHNTNGNYKYIPQKIGELQNPDSYVSVVNKNVCNKPFLSEEAEGINECNNIKNRNTGSSSISADTFPCNQNLQPAILDSGFSNMTEPLNELGKNVEEIEQTVNVPHPDVVRDALATGTVLESQGEDGQGYLIVLPKALAEKDYTLITLPPMPAPKVSTVSESMVVQENELGDSNCDLLVWDNDLDAVTEVAFEPEKEFLPIDDVDDKEKKLRRSNLSACEEVVVHGGLHTKKSVRIQRKEKKMKDKKNRIPKSYECQHCGKDCKTSSNFIIHMRTHTGERPYYCDYCGLGFKQIAHLKAHIRIHTGEHPYKCNLCDAAFKQSSRLKSHQRTQHVNGKVKKKKIVKEYSIRNFYCKICDKTFLDSCYKKQHMKTHADEVQYNCDRCNAVFKTRDKLKKHYSFHADDSWGICEMCGFQFNNMEALNIHKQMSHKGDIIDSKEDGSNIHDLKTYQVGQGISENDGIERDIHDSVLISDSNLKQRNGSHTDYSEHTEDLKKTKGTSTINQAGSILYQCKICKKSFRQNSNLKTHMRMHTDERPYKCNNCERAFRQISHLKDHVKMHTGEKPFRCSSCSAAFTQSSGVKYHIKKYHRGKAHVVKEQKCAHLKDKESIILENATQMIDDTVVINIENGMSVLVEHKPFEKGTEISKPEDKDTCRNCGENLVNSVKFHRCPQKKCVRKCEACNRSIRKLGDISNKVAEPEKQHLCKKCTAPKKSLTLIKSTLVCKEEPNEEDTEVMSSKTDNQFISKKNNGNVYETYGKKSKHCNEYEGTFSELVDSKKNTRQYGEGTRSVCDICGKTFGRASALKFHKQMSHKYTIDEEEEENIHVNWKGEDNGMEEDVKHPSELVTKQPKGESNQHKSFPFKIKEEAKDVTDCEIVYCKCSFCGEKLPDLQKLNDHVSILHPKEIFSEECKAYVKSEISDVVTSRNTSQNKRKRVTKKNDLETKSISVIKKISENFGGENLVMNINSHYRCHGCEKTFSRVAKLKDHINSWCKAKRNLKNLL